MEGSNGPWLDITILVMSYLQHTTRKFALGVAFLPTKAG